MYLEFKLPTGAAGHAANFALNEIKNEVKLWAEKYNIKYSQKTIKWTHRVGFNEPEHFTLFSMTWNPTSKRSWMAYEVIHIANERY